MNGKRTYGKDGLLIPNTQKTGSWRDLVPEGKANLGGGERHFAAVRLQETTKVGEDTLRRLRTQVAVLSASRTDLNTQYEQENFQEIP